MKRIFFVSFLLLILLSISNLVFANVSIDLQLIQQKVNVGDTFTVNVNTNQISDLKGINLLFSFDNLRLKYKSIDKGQVINDFVEDILPKPEISNTTGKMEYMAVREARGSGVDFSGGNILTLTFVAISPGQATIKLEANSVSLSNSIPNLIPAKLGDERSLQIGELQRIRVFNYPNPAPDMNGRTIIHCQAFAFLEDLEVRIHDISGELVKIIDFQDFNKDKAPTYEYEWDCKNANGRDVANGTYILWARASFEDSDDKSKDKYETWKIAIIR